LKKTALIALRHVTGCQSFLLQASLDFNHII